MPFSCFESVRSSLASSLIFLVTSLHCLSVQSMLSRSLWSSSTLRGGAFNSGMVSMLFIIVSRRLAVFTPTDAAEPIPLLQPIATKVNIVVSSSSDVKIINFFINSPFSL